MKKPVIFYVRVSSQEQGKSGVGLVEQEAALAAWCQKKLRPIAAVYREVASVIGRRSLDHRPQLQAALNHCRETGADLLVNGIDRLTRFTPELEDIVVASGVKILDVTDRKNGAIATLVAESAQKEARMQIQKERIRQGIEKAKRRGVKFGNPKNLLQASAKGASANVENARAALKLMRREIALVSADGRPSSKAIADHLNSKGMRTRQGKLWTAVNVRRVLRSLNESSTSSGSSQDGAVERQLDNPLWGMF